MFIFCYFLNNNLQRQKTQSNWDSNLGMSDSIEPSLGQANYHFVHFSDSKDVNVNNQERGCRRKNS